MLIKKVRNQRCQKCSGSGQVAPTFTTLNVNSSCSDCNGYGYRVIFSNQKNLQRAIRVDQIKIAESFF